MTARQLESAGNSAREQRLLCRPGDPRYARINDDLHAPLRRATMACKALLQRGTPHVLGVPDSNASPSPLLWRRCLRAVHLDSDQVR
jgi:hypothetical protein